MRASWVAPWGPWLSQGVPLEGSSLCEAAHQCARGALRHFPISFLSEPVSAGREWGPQENQGPVYSLCLLLLCLPTAPVATQTFLSAQQY